MYINTLNVFNICPVSVSFTERYLIFLSFLTLPWFLKAITRVLYSSKLFNFQDAFFVVCLATCNLIIISYFLSFVKCLFVNFSLTFWKVYDFFRFLSSFPSLRLNPLGFLKGSPWVSFIIISNFLAFVNSFFDIFLILVSFTIFIVITS